MASTPKKRTLADGTVMWDVRVYVGKRRYETRSFPSERAAKAHGNGREVDKQRRRLGDPRRARQTIRTHAEEWFEKREGLWAPDTVRLRRWLLDDHVLPFVGDVKVEAFDRDDAELFIAKLLKAGRSKATTNDAAGVLSAVFESLLTKEVLAVNPFGRGRSRVSVGDIERREPMFLEPVVLDGLAEAIAARFTGAVLLGGYGGLRYGEVFGLRRKYVVDDCTRIQVREQLTWPKAEKYRARVGAPLKTRTSRRDVEVPPWVADELRAQLRGRPLDRDALVFVGAKGGPVRPETFYRGDWKAAKAAVALPELHFHDLRHTAASIAAHHGATLHAVSRFLGHANPTITMNLYTHLFGDAAQQVAAAMAAVRSGGVVPLRRLGS